MIGFRGLYARTDDLWTGGHWVPIRSEECWKCERPKPDLAHMINEYIAAVIGAELERRVWAAVAEHEVAHGCHWFRCDEAWEIVQLMPEAMIPVAMAAS